MRVPGSSRPITGRRHRRHPPLAVHAKDENARRFYEHFGFIPSPTDARHLYLLVKDIKRLRWQLAPVVAGTRRVPWLSPDSQS